ncbi:MAG: ribonuclease HII [Thermosynechococcaceae cyanobacterium]
MLTSQIVAGVDEVGRGCLFGPVVAAAVIVPQDCIEPLQTLGVTDSKQLSAQRRSHLYQQITMMIPDCRIGMASVKEIDRLNILQASLLAMKRAIGRLYQVPDLCLVDGNQTIPNLEIAQRTVVKGDQKELAIASASIIAKVWRDQLIIRLAQKYDGYDLASNKGYGTRRHREALTQLGPSRLHRLSFAPCQLVLQACSQ